MPRTNRLAIVAFVTGLCGLVLLAVGFAIAALVQAGRRGERGKGLAVGALVVSAVWAITAAVALAVAVGSLVTADRDESGQVTGKDRVLPAALRVGDCVTDFEAGSLRTPVTALPCTEPHESEVVAQAELPEGDFPGNRRIHELSTDACYLKTIRFLKSRHYEHLEPYLIMPTKTNWDAGDRNVLCLLTYTGPGTITLPLAQTLDPKLKYWTELAYGDCFGKSDSDAPTQRVLSCTQEHWSQVYAVLTMKPGPYPGPRAMERKADATCEKQLKKAFGKRPYPEYYSFYYAEKFEWDGGIRTVVCFGTSEKRLLKKSMLPR
ncbi:DUF4190 domain-containing protein [Actinomadura sp. KC216]|uniref:DUF4190 domain-containing protein n=1 Tax=Actinomadura sp. KC216 TaxID=2530370 RepID=UPI001405164C|nr:DUF4190 domain-containing protein [Actinomadura sp. KC216]